MKTFGPVNVSVRKSESFIILPCFCDLTSLRSAQKYKTKDTVR